MKEIALNLMKKNSKQKIFDLVSRAQNSEQDSTIDQ
jgi:hypothetical protein